MGGASPYLAPCAIAPLAPSPPKVGPDYWTVQGSKGFPPPMERNPNMGHSLYDGSFLHVETDPVLALGPIALPISIRMVVRQA